MVLAESVTAHLQEQSIQACLAAALSALARKTRITGITCGRWSSKIHSGFMMLLSFFRQTFGMTPISVSQGADPTNR
jgi:hypothetical protein